MKIMLSVAGLLTALGWVSMAPALHRGDLHDHLMRAFHGAHESSFVDHLDEMADKLELGEAQRKQLASALTTNLAGLQPVVEEFTKAFAAQAASVHALVSDESAVRKAAAALSSVQEELVVGVARLVRDVHAVLTADQLARLKEGIPADLSARARDHMQEVTRSVLSWAERQ